MNPDFFSIDWQAFFYSFNQFASQDPLTIGWQIFFGGGWVIFAIVMVYAVYLVWLDGRQGKFASKWQWTLLAIDIPKNNEQTPKAVESIFTALAGAQKNPNLVDKYWEGWLQESFSFEVISLEGYIQFLVRTPTHFRDLIEAAVYAQYPDAEIIEVEDYAATYKDLRFPNEQYNLWGTEMVLIKDYPYPIRSYEEFEHKLSGNLIDPMAGLLEIMSRFGAGEQLWLQLVITPQPPPGWGEKAKKIVTEFTGQTYTPPSTLIDKLIKPVELTASGAASVVESFLGASSEDKKKEEDQWKMFKITPGQRTVMEKIERKLSKHAFRVKFRLIYLAEKNVFSKGRGVAAVIGAIQQFNTTDANGFKPGKRTKTAVDYFRVGARTVYRQNFILKQFIKRGNYYGEEVGNMFLNPEELASIWHFPVISVKATLVEKIESKKAAPPSRLPYEARQFELKPKIGELAPTANLGETDFLPSPVAPQSPLLNDDNSASEVAPEEILPPPSPLKQTPEIKKIIRPATASSVVAAPIRKQAAPPPNLPVV